jgi:uncharacterized protein YjbI with pentapeptide repeats
MRRADFGGSTFDNCTLKTEGADLTGAQFTNVTIQGKIEFKEAALDKVNFSCAKGAAIAIQGCGLDDADFVGAAFVAPEFTATSAIRARFGKQALGIGPGPQLSVPKIQISDLSVADFGRCDSLDASYFPGRQPNLAWARLNAKAPLVTSLAGQKGKSATEPGFILVVSEVAKPEKNDGAEFHLDAYFSRAANTDTAEFERVAIVDAQSGNQFLGRMLAQIQQKGLPFFGLEDSTDKNPANWTTQELKHSLLTCRRWKLTLDPVKP